MKKTNLIPESWEALPYGEHWSFAYTPERGEREDYDFSIEFNEAVDEAEELAVIHLIEAAPQLLEALIECEAYLIGCGMEHDASTKKASSAIAKATGRAA